MNKETRARIDGLIKDVEAVATDRAEIDTMIEALNDKLTAYRNAFEEVKSSAEEIRDEEQEKFDNLSEGFQQSERGQNIQEAVNALDEAINAIDNMPSDEIEFEFDADEIIGALNNAKGY